MSITYIKEYAEKSGAILEITSVIASDTVAFNAFLTSFSDNMTSSWNEEQVYGRPDPIGTFQNTSRKISIGFDIPAKDLAEAKANLNKVNKLKQFMYPAYSSNTDNNATTNALSLSKSPLIRLKFANLIRNQDGAGLLGWINSFSATPVIDMGMFNEGSEKTAKLFPKVYNATIDFTPQHEFDLGWTSEGAAINKSSFPSFPYDGGTKQ